MFAGGATGCRRLRKWRRGLAALFGVCFVQCKWGFYKSEYDSGKSNRGGALAWICAQSESLGEGGYPYVNID